MLEIIATAAPRLVELALVNTRLPDDAVRALLLERPWPKLERLYLSGNELSTELVAQLASQFPSAAINSK